MLQLNRVLANLTELNTKYLLLVPASGEQFIFVDFLLEIEKFDAILVN